jgi:hypothetical protein
MPTSFPVLWLLLALPFVSMAVIRQIPPLMRLANTHNHITWPVGVAGLLCLYAGALGLPPTGHQLILMAVAGSLAGFSMLYLPQGEPGSDGDDWRRRRPPDEPPPKPPGDGPVDWAGFDRMRARWERDGLLRH